MEVPAAWKAKRFANQTRAITSGYLDYSWQNSNDLSYVFSFNSNIATANTDTGLNYCGVALMPFQGLFDYADNTYDFDITPFPATYTFTVDSLYALITHENNSSQPDTLIMQLVQLSGTNALTTTATVKWSDTVITSTSLSPSGNWLGTNALYVLAFAPNYTSAAGEKLGIVFINKSPRTDSLGVLGSCIDDGTGGTMTQSINPTSFLRYPPNILTLAPNRNVGYGNPVGSAGWIEAQDWEISAKVTFDDVTGVSDVASNLTVYQNIPNPSSNSTIIKYDLNKESDIKLAIYDVTGRIVYEKAEDKVLAGNHKITVDLTNITSGTYFYKFTANGKSVTKKMIVTK